MQTEKEVEQDVIYTELRVHQLLLNIRKNPMAYRTHWNLISEIQELAGKLHDPIFTAENKEMEVADKILSGQYAEDNEHGQFGVGA